MQGKVAARRVVSFPSEIKPLVCPNAISTLIGSIGEFGSLSNGSAGAGIENPGALAGATGANVDTVGIVSIYYRKRAEAATSLCEAIAECDEDDAIVILGAALKDLPDKEAFGGNPFFREAVSHYRAERSRSGTVI